MAAAEARAAWQRTANRYFVQEDAKRAPKLACGPSSSSKPHVDMGPNDVANGMRQGSTGFVPFNWNTSNSNLPPDTKWWLQLQPNYGHQKDFSSEQLNLLEMELESLRNAESKRMTNLSEDPPVSEEVPGMSTERNAASSLDLRPRVSATCMKNEPGTMSHSVTQKTSPQKKMEEYWLKDDEFMDIDPVSSFISKQPEKLFNMESPWMASQKTEPWWRTADKDELASIVAQKSLEHVENCDLPPPQTKHVRTGPFACLESFDQDGIFTCDRKGLSGLCSSVDHSWGCLACGSSAGKQQGSGERASSYGLDKSLRMTANNGKQHYCSCGGGLCNVQMSHTKTNPNRLFITCPNQGASIGCGLWQWHDEVKICPCNAGISGVKTCKTSITPANVGRRFYNCPRSSVARMWILWMVGSTEGKQGWCHFPSVRSRQLEST